MYKRQVVSHIIPTHHEIPRKIADPASSLQALNLKKNCVKHNIPLFDTNHPLQGIEHVVSPEHGMVRPGMVIICGDSHTTTYGALGALGFGIGTSEVEHVLATQTLVYRLAKNMHIKINGTLPVGTTSKDMILNIISQIGAKGAIGYVVEFSGSALIDLSTEARFTLCNMAVEAGARGALIAPDKTAIDYVLARCPDITGEIKDRALVHWASLYSDADAQFEKAYEFDASDMAPFVTWGTSPDQAIAINAAIPTKDLIEDPIDKLSLEQALRYTQLSDGQTLEGTPIDLSLIHISEPTRRS